MHFERGALPQLGLVLLVVRGLLLDDDALYYEAPGVAGDGQFQESADQKADGEGGETCCWGGEKLLHELSSVLVVMSFLPV